MKIKILGNGGAINQGLPYNAFLIDDAALVELPPDIMPSLHREGVDPSNIGQIYISHLHGDHCFGFPFLALSLFINRTTITNAERPLRVYVPSRGKEYLLRLSAMALSEGHPCIQWIKDRLEFIPVDTGRGISLLGHKTELYRMDHFEETRGFLLSKEGRSLFAYTADTLWCTSVERMIKASPAVMLADLNGEPDDAVPIHMSEQDLMVKGIPLAGGATRFFGTHLKYQKKNPDGAPIEYVRPGMDIETEG